MSFRRELSVIPRTAWIIAFIFYAGCVIGVHFGMSQDPQMSQWPLAGQLAFQFLVPLFVFPVVAFYGYVFGDARRRGMNAIGWMLLALFVPYLIGVIIYFCIRDPLPTDCSNCRAAVPGKFTFCPNCGHALRPYCPQCGKSVERGWSNCAHCGTKLPAQG
ncbi:MAG: zinc ribbon domain-containing protein [Candidatus Acidiferrales bacterium]